MKLTLDFMFNGNKEVEPCSILSLDLQQMVVSLTLDTTDISVVTPVPLMFT